MSDKTECQGCEKEGPDVQRRRQNTAYEDDESNYATLCADCQEVEDEYWHWLWAQFCEGRIR